jgi:hypothetical protein
VKGRGIVLRVGVAFAFFGKNVRHHRAVLIREAAEDLPQQGNVVAVQGADVAEAQVGKKRLAVQYRLGAFFDAPYHVHKAVSVTGNIFQCAVYGPAQIPVEFTCRKPRQVRGERPHILRYGHGVVVKDDNQALPQLPRVVHGFQRHAAR